MKSITRTLPVAVVCVVSRTNVSPQYVRAGAVAAPAGASSQRPLAASPRSAVKTASESKRGRQSQSIDPLRPTSAAVPRSPISA
jgi:hypothetical protein